MKDIELLMMKFGFSRTEARVYLDLVGRSALTGYQISRDIGLSRSSVYAALDGLYRKGAVELLPGESSLYKAKDPALFISELKRGYARMAETLEAELSTIHRDENEQRFLNIEGRDNIINKAKELMLTAREEIFLNTDFDPLIFEKEFSELGHRGVRIVIFSFSELDAHGLPVEIYSYHYPCCPCSDTRVMLSVDSTSTLISSNMGGGGFVGAYTQNKLMVSIVTEHIHHDIYLLRLHEKYKKDLLDDSIKIGTRFEQRSALNRKEAAK